MESPHETDPREVGGYQILARLGSGGMGRVYLARSPGLRRVALKVVHPHLAAAPGFRTRFAREVEVARQVGGVYTASVIDADVRATMPWLATEYLPGPTLSAAVREHGPIEGSELRELTAALAEALDAIHRAGLVHRDLKPGNVLLTSDGPRVIDFGIAKALDAATATHTGRGFGTPAYLSPEQAEGHDVTDRSDVFALGSILSFASTGAPPFGTEPPASVIYRVVREDPQLGGVPEPLRDLVAACLTKAPEGRPNAREVLRTVGGAPGRVQWNPEGSIAQLVTQRERATLAGVPGTAGRARGRLARVARHPAGWGGASLAGGAALALGAAILAGVDTPGLGGEEVPVRVLDPASTTQLGIDLPAASPTLQAISLDGQHYARVAAEPGGPLVTVDLDARSQPPEQAALPEDAAPASVGVTGGGWAVVLDEQDERDGGKLALGRGAETTGTSSDRFGPTSVALGSAPDEYAVGEERNSFSVHRGGDETSSSHGGDVEGVENTPVTEIALSRNGEFVASATALRTIAISSSDSSGSGSQLQMDQDDIHAAETLPMEEAPDGTPGEAGTMSDTHKAVTAIAVGNDGDAAVFALGDMAYYMETAFSGNVSASPLPRATGDAEIDSVAISPDGELVAASGVAGAINIWRADPQQRVASMTKPEGSAPIAFTDDGQTLRAVDAQDRLVEWDIDGLA